jgi:adenylosuccinate lyase
MPFKRNPVNAEKIDSLARMLAQMPRQAWDNAANSILERTLDDSANRRTLLPEAFLICDELLTVAEKIIKDLQINQTAIDKNLAIYGPFAATERVLMALVKKGANRQEMHEMIRKHALKAWEAVQEDQPNPLKEMILSEKEFLSLLSKEVLSQLMNAKDYTGDAPQRAKAFAKRIREIIPQTE